jgi:hypothetical protein
VTDANNGARNETLATLNTLADLVAVCGSDPSAAARGQVLRATTPAGRPAPPDAWILALLYTDDGLYASGRIAVDGRGNVWSSDDWQPGTKDPSTGFTNGGLNHPQGIAVDQRGNVWIANNFGPESDPGQGNAWVSNAGLGGARPVGTRAAILVGKFGGSVTVIGPDFKPTASSPIQSKSFRWPLGIAIDSRNNPWVVNPFANNIMQLKPSGRVASTVKLPRGVVPWSDATDGSNRVWIAGFGPAAPASWS